MLGFLTSKDERQAANYARMIKAGVRRADLHGELFEALKSGHLKTAQNIVDMGTAVAGLAVYGASCWGGRYETGTWGGDPNHPDNSISDWFAISADVLLTNKIELYSWEDERRGQKDFETFLKAQRQPQIFIYDPLSYLIAKGNFSAADLLIRNGYPCDIGRDDPTEIFHRAPLYHAIDENALAVFTSMLEHGAKASDRVLGYAVKKQKPEFVLALIQRGASIEVGKQALADLVQAQNLKQKTFDALAQALKLPALQKKESETPIETVKKLLAHGANVDKLAATPTPAPAVPDHQVIFESPMADMMMQEIYDFQRKERVTLFKKGDDIKNSLRQTFNDLGQKDAGLQKAIGVYAGRHPGFNYETLFSKPSTFKIVSG